MPYDSNGLALNQSGTPLLVNQQFFNGNNSSTEMTNCDLVDVTVTGSDGTDTAPGAFAYDDPPPPEQPAAESSDEQR